MAEVATSRPQPVELAMTGISKHFGMTVALDGVDFSIRSGEIRALIGENGAGKSTLMKVLSGAVFPDSGRMTLDGTPYRPPNPLAARRAGIGMIYQELSLAPHLTVAENILLGAEPSRSGILDFARMRQTATLALTELGHADIPVSALVSSLPPPIQQVVEIARALASGCRILVLDEPTSSLSAADTSKLFSVLRDLRQRGYAIVYISHFLEEVEKIADRYTVLRDGRSVGDGDTSQWNTDAVIRMMVGRSIDQLYPNSSRRQLEPVLDVSSLAGRRLPRSASLMLHRGEVFGIAGLVGAGRTELIRAIFGLDPIRSGTVRVGIYSGRASPHRRWMQNTGMLSENRKTEGLATDLSVSDNITLSKLSGLGPAGLVFRRRQDDTATAWIRKLGIKCRSARQRVGTLSGGNQQKAALARLLYHGVDLLLLDEPTRGIDVASKAQIYALIDSLVAPTDNSRPCAVLMASSYLPELLGVCDRIAVMCRGCLGEARPVRDCSQEQLMREATGNSSKKDG